MSKPNRQSLIKQIEQRNSSMVISYVTGDRPNVGAPNQQLPTTQIFDDAVRIIRDHLESVKEPIEKIDLFLYSRGGYTMTPYRMVQLLREYCKTLSVLIPYRAHSAATLIALGADHIYMGRMGELSPVDPTTATVFSPTDPANPSARWGVSVEDVSAYLQLAREKFGLVSEDKLLEVFKALETRVHPLALGNVERVYGSIRMIAYKLLSLHMNSKSIEEEKTINDIITALEERLFTHDYLITRKEAKDSIGLKISYPDQGLEDLMWKLYLEYEVDLNLRDPFNAEALLGNTQTLDFSYETAYIESASLTDAYVQEGTIFRPPNQPQQIQQIASTQSQRAVVKFKSQKWTKVP